MNVFLDKTQTKAGMASDEGALVWPEQGKSPISQRKYVFLLCVHQGAESFNQMDTGFRLFFCIPTLRRITQSRRYRFMKVIGRKRFLQKALNSGLVGLCHRQLGIAREKEKGNLRFTVLSYNMQEFDSITTWHGNIGNDQIDPVLSEELNCLRDTRGGEDLITAILQIVLHDLAEFRLIIDDQNSFIIGF